MAKKNTAPRQYRCSLNAIREVLKDIKKSLAPPRQQKRLKAIYKAMDKTPFKHLFMALCNEQEEYKRRSNKTLDRVLGFYNKEEKAFCVAGQLYKPTKLDVKLIFGVEDGDDEIQHNPKFNVSTKRKATELKQELFGRKKLPKLTQSCIKDKVKELVLNKASPEDIVRVLCLLLFESVFFANTGSSLAWKFLNFVADFDILNSYDWSKYILDELNRGLDKKDWKSDPTKVTGCTLFLEYLFCEYCQQTCDIYEKQIKPIQIPRFKKWEMSTFNEAVEKTFTTDVRLKFKWKKLIPSPAELELILSLKGMREVIELTDSDALLVFDEEEHLEVFDEEKHLEKKIAELEEEVRRKHLQLEVEQSDRIDIQRKLDEQVAHTLLLEAEQMECINIQQKLDEQVARSTELKSQIATVMAQLHAPRPPAPRRVNFIKKPFIRYIPGRKSKGLLQPPEPGTQPSNSRKRKRDLRKRKRKSTTDNTDKLTR